MLTAMLLCAAMFAQDDVPAELLTVAESSGYTKTATYEQVMELIDRIEAKSTIMRRATMGQTVERRDIPLVILANPPIENAQQAKASGKPIVFVFGNIHAGEVCGKEALLMLTREIGLNPDHPLLNDLVLVFAPIYNADGNERFDPGNRPGQNGPDEMGQRPNADGLDLNRDYIKLESPEARAMVAFMTEWDPQIAVDLHTTNGSYHQYTLTFDYPLNPSGHEAPISFVRDDLLPAVRQRLEANTGYKTFFYGNFNRDMTTWTTYSAQPRYGGPYHGLRGTMGILSEAYSYAPYRDRVLCTREFVREIMQYAAENEAEVIERCARARQETIAAGANPQPSDVVGLRHAFAAYPEPVTMEAWEMETPAAEPGGRRGRGRARPTDRPMEYSVVHLGRFESTLSVRRPHAYIIAPGNDGVIEKLRQHGIDIRPYSGVATVEQYTITDVQRSGRPFQGHQNVQVAVGSTVNQMTAGDGWHLVSTAQPLGNLIVYLLEPQSEDGLLAWNFFDDHLEVGSAFPVYRIRSAEDLNPR